jgi:hypothetical protein
MMNDTITKVFISYSHDSDEHKKWVLDLSNKLRNDHIDVILDQTDLGLGSNIGALMNMIKEVDRVLVICTYTYYHKSLAQKGGVAYENYLMTNEIIKDIGSKKFIPIIRQDVTKEDGSFYIPIALEPLMYLDFSNDIEFSYEYKKLIKDLHNQPLEYKQPIGTSPFDFSDENVTKKGIEYLTEIYVNYLNKQEVIKNVSKVEKDIYKKIATIQGHNLELYVLNHKNKIKFEAYNGTVSRTYQQDDVKRIIKIFEKAENGNVVNEIINKDLNITTRINSPKEWFLIFQFYNNESDYPDRASVWILKEDFAKFINILQQSIKED